MSLNKENLLDVAAGAVGVSTFFDWLPHIAALFTVIWLGLRIVEALLNLRGILLRKDWCRKTVTVDSEEEDESDRAGV